MRPPSDRYTQDDHRFRENDPYAAAKYDLTLRWLHEKNASGTLANVGCGGGLFNDLAIAAGFRVLAYEPDEAACAVAAARALPGCTVEAKGLFAIAPDTQADVAVMHDVLEHIDAEAAAVERLAGLLPPRGLAIVSVPALESLFGFHDVQLGHFRRYTKSTLRRALEPHFEMEDIRYFGISMVPVSLWFSRIRQAPYPTAQVGEAGAASRVLARVLAAETRIRPPIGTSVIAIGRRR